MKQLDKGLLFHSVFSYGLVTCCDRITWWVVNWFISSLLPVQEHIFLHRARLDPSRRGFREPLPSWGAARGGGPWETSFGLCRECVDMCFQTPGCVRIEWRDFVVLCAFLRVDPCLNCDDFFLDLIRSSSSLMDWKGVDSTKCDVRLCYDPFCVAFFSRSSWVHNLVTLSLFLLFSVLFVSSSGKFSWRKMFSNVWKFSSVLTGETSLIIFFRRICSPVCSTSARLLGQSFSRTFEQSWLLVTVENELEEVSLEHSNFQPSHNRRNSFQ